MKIKTLFLSLILSVCLGSPAWAATINTDCSSAANVNTALANASSGDTVLCTGNGWSSGRVTLPNTKNITLDGNGATVSGSAGLALPSSANYTGRVTNFTFSGIGAGSIQATGNFTNKPWRFDHVTFANIQVTASVIETGKGPGLIDHMTATLPAYAQFFEPRNIGSETDSSTWQDVLTPGSPNFIYIEDSTFTHSGSIWDGSCVMQQLWGSRYVVRKSTLNNVMLETHGNPGWVGGRWWEYYDNTCTNCAICSRSGSGIIFNNTGTMTFIMLGEEDSGTPLVPYQIGTGQGGTSSFPAYVWSNPTNPSLNASGLCANVSAGMVRLNTDVFYPTSGTTLPGTCSVGQGFWKTDAGGNWDTSNGTANDGMLYKCTAANTWTPYYTPYTYPHPLQSGTGGGITARPSAPSGLTIN